MTLNFKIIFCLVKININNVTLLINIFLYKLTDSDLGLLFLKNIFNSRQKGHLKNVQTQYNNI